MRASSIRKALGAARLARAPFAPFAPSAQRSLLARHANTLAAGKYENPQEVYASVQNYYGKVLTASKDLKTNACTTSGKPHKIILDALAKVPAEIKDKYYGCGIAVPFGIEGLHVLDLGSGSGQDCYIASNLVGPKGSVTGIDMTDAQLEVARKHVASYSRALQYPAPNLSFKKGYIEFIKEAGVADGSMDLVISNCVINLSPDKKRVIEGVYRALRNGGELYFSDVYCNRRLPDHVRNHKVLLGECLGGALYIEDFLRICRQVGFTDPRQLEISTIEVTDPELQALVGEAKFYSITYRCFKAEGLETQCEDYGQVARYKGTIPGHPNAYLLDDHHLFEKNKPMLVCGNTALMVGSTWLGKHFEVVGDMSTHYGLFDCSTPAVPAKNTSAPASGAGGACC